MARVTTEDCAEYVQNRFELVALAAERAKELHSGSAPIVERDNDKYSVIALREIAAGYSTEVLREALVTRMQKLNKIDDIENDDDSSEGEEVSDDFEYVADGTRFLMEEESEEIETEDSFEDLSEDMMQEKD